MDKKTAVIFLDGDVMKIVFGRTVKEFPAEKAKDEKAFFERLFEGYRVVVVERATEVTFSQLMDEEHELDARPPGREPEPPPEPNTSRTERWIRSTSRTTIVIDDLPTTTEISPGHMMSFSVPNDRAVRMSNVRTEDVDKSAILKRLLANGTLEWVSSAEASRMESDYATRMAQENDARLDQWAPIIDGVRAEDYAADPNKRTATAGSEPETVDVDAEEPSEQEQMASMVPARKEPAGEEEDQSPVPARARVSTTPRYGMSELMDEIEELEKEGVREPARRKVTGVKAIDGANPKGISKRR